MRPRAREAALSLPRMADTPLVRAWRDLEQLLNSRGVEWALHYAPADLAWERAPKWASSIDAFLPADYRAFVAAVGYPMLGFSLYCDAAWSFLPPNPRAFFATQVFDRDGNEPDKRPFAVLFAAFHDLADITGYGFVPDSKGAEPIVWVVEDAMPRKKLAPFTPWMLGELKRIGKHVAGLTPEAIAGLLAEQDGKPEPDPHRLIDYSEA